MPIGFEYGFRKRLNVVNTQPEDWEASPWDISEFIAAVNHLKNSYRVFNEEGLIERVESGNPKVVALPKSSRDSKEKVLLLFNTDQQRRLSCQLAADGLRLYWPTQVQDVSPDGQLQHTPDFQIGQLKPSGVHVIYGRQ